MYVFAEEVIAPSQDGSPFVTFSGSGDAPNSLDLDCVHFTPAAARRKAFDKALSGGLMGKKWPRWRHQMGSGRWIVRRISHAE